MRDPCHPAIVAEPHHDEEAAVSADTLQLQNFAPGALCVIWAVCVNRPRQGHLRDFDWDCIARTPELDVVARELVRIGMLQVQPPPGKALPWINRYCLAPLELPLDRKNSVAVRLITNALLDHQNNHMVRDLRAVPGLLAKLLGGLHHPDAGSHLEYVHQFL
jgi:hypothetical protein